MPKWLVMVLSVVFTFTALQIYRASFSVSQKCFIDSNGGLSCGQVWDAESLDHSKHPAFNRPPVKPAPQPPRTGNKAADICLASDEYKQPETTAALCQKAASDESLSSKLQSQIHVHLADAYHFSFQSPLAISTASKAITMAPENPNAWIARANARMGQEDRDGAISDAKKALELEPENIDALISLSWAAGDTEFGEQVTGQILQKDLNNPIGLLNMSALMANRGVMDASLYWLDMFLELDPAKITAARIYLPRGRNALSPRDFGLYRRASLREAMGQISAMDDYDELVRNNPNNINILLERAGASLFLKNDPQQALLDAQAVLKMDPSNEPASAIQKESLKRMGQYM